MHINKKPNDSWLPALMLETRGKLRGSLLKILDAEDVEDVIQEAYLKIYELVNAGKTIENIPALLFRIARNSAISRLRHNKVVFAATRAVFDSDCARLAQISNEERLRQDQEKQILMRAVAALSAGCRQVFLLRKFENKTHNEISALLNISTKTVENHITKAIKHCRNFVMAELKASAAIDKKNQNKHTKVV